MPIELRAAPDAGFSAFGEIAPPEILALPMPHERRWLLRDECALLLDRYLRRLALQESLCRRVLGRLASAFLRRRSHHRLGVARLGDYTRERLGISGRGAASGAAIRDPIGDDPALHEAALAYLSDSNPMDAIRSRWSRLADEGLRPGRLWSLAGRRRPGRLVTGRSTPILLAKHSAAMKRT